jgi:hypothetical protein
VPVKFEDVDDMFWLRWLVLEEHYYGISLSKWNLLNRMLELLLEM